MIVFRFNEAPVGAGDQRSVAVPDEKHHRVRDLHILQAKREGALINGDAIFLANDVRAVLF
jgi:hypothetical protein